MREPGIHPFRITRIRYFRVQTPRFLAQEGILNDLAPPRFVISSEPDPRKTLVQWFLVIQLGFTASSHTKRSQAISPKREHIFIIIIIISGSSIVSICIYVYMYTYIYIYICLQFLNGVIVLQFAWDHSTASLLPLRRAQALHCYHYHNKSLCFIWTADILILKAIEPQILHVSNRLSSVSGENRKHMLVVHAWESICRET